MTLPHDMKSVICMTGPTASGKSGLAVRLAKLIDGEIINADSMQVYNALHILTARPNRIDMEGVPHHLYGHIDGDTRYSVGQWAVECAGVIIDCLSRGKRPILVGGTGLYFKALLDGIAHVPQPSREAEAHADAILARGIDQLRTKAEALDPVATRRVLGKDPHRLLRIVAVALGTDKLLSEWQVDTRPQIPRGYWRGFVVMPDRETVYGRINERFKAMISGGAVEEVRALVSRGISPAKPVMKAIGVPPLQAYISGDVSLDWAITRSQRDSRRYAKRQMTWIRSHQSTWEFVDSDKVWTRDDLE